MFRIFVKRPFINKINYSRYLFDFNNNKNNSPKDYFKDDTYKIISSDLNKIDKKIEWLQFLSLPPILVIFKYIFISMII